MFVVVVVVLLLLLLLLLLFVVVVLVVVGVVIISCCYHCCVVVVFVTWLLIHCCSCCLLLIDCITYRSATDLCPCFCLTTNPRILISVVALHLLFACIRSVRLLVLAGTLLLDLAFAVLCRN